MYLSTVEELEAFCTRARRQKVVAVDTEFLREKTYHPHLCLVQLATHDEAAIVDTLAIDDLSALTALMADDGVTKVFHACGQDLEVLYDSLGCLPGPVFDTQVAAAFLGQRMQMGYGALVEVYEGVHLPKDAGLTDWSKRPLHDDQIRYALDDVIYLPRIYDRMMAELVERDRLGWVMPEIEELVDESKVRRDPLQAYVHLKRASTLTRKQLAVAREICAWREKRASSRDIPKRWLLSDEVVVELSRRMPRTTENLHRIRGTEHMGERDTRQLLTVIQKGAHIPPEDYPSLPHRPHSNAGADSVIDLMYALLRLESQRCGVALPLIATREDLHSFVAGKKACRLRSGWRWDVVGQSLDGLLRGEVGLTVKDGRVELL